MKITQVRLGRISTPLRVPFKTALRTVNSVEDVIVELHTDTGAVGYGEAPPTGVITGDTTGAILGAIQDHIAPALLGRDLDEFEDLTAAVQKALVHNTSAKAAVDMALWDLLGQKYSAPVYRMLGGARRNIVTDITISVNPPEEMARDARTAVQRGYDCLKVKVGKEPEKDIARLSAIRGAVPKETCIRIDANQGWTPKEAVRILVNDLKKQGIALKTGAKMLRIEKNGGLLRAVYKIDGKEEATDCEQVLMAAGRKTNLSGIDADALGLKLDGKKCIVVDAHQRTSLPGVYAIGDVVGGFQLAHAAYAEGEAALADMLGEDRPYGTMPVPVCTYTIPCFASVGLTTQRAKDAGYEPVLGSFDYSANGMALAEGASGAVFVVADKATTRTLGVTIVGENSSEMIAMAASAVADGLTTDQWEKMIVAHPSLCEMVREAALDAFGKSVHKG